MGQPGGYADHRTQLCPASKDWEDTFEPRHPWPLAPHGTVTGGVRAEWRPREPECRGPRRGVLSWGQVEKKKEEPTLSVRLLCARPRAGPQVPCAILRPCTASVGLAISVEGPVGGVGGVGVLPRRCLSLEPRFMLPPWSGGWPRGQEGGSALRGQPAGLGA